MKTITNNSPTSDFAYRVDFEHTELCVNCNPRGCAVEGEIIPIVGTWRDLLMDFVEKFVVNHPERIEYLLSNSLSTRGRNPFLFTENPGAGARQISSGQWVNLNFSIPYLVDSIGMLSRYCGFDLKDVVITYASKPRRMNSEVSQKAPKRAPIFKALPTAVVPKSVINILKTYYANGFRFETTSIRLLSEKAQIEIDSDMQKTLKSWMFCRSDNVWFWPDLIANDDTRMNIINTSDEWLNDCGFFVMSQLYHLYAGSLNSHCICDLSHFTSFYKFLNYRDVRCVKCHQIEVARVHENLNDLTSALVSRILGMLQDPEACGTLEEETLLKRFSGLSAELLANIMKYQAEQIVRTKINEVVCYQTLDALGFTDDFSETLAEVLEQIEDVGLVPSEEVLHTVLSIRLGINFKAEYNIPDDKVFRKVVEMYYKNAPVREWRGGKFAEVSD